jgi:hypothetical protein
MYLRIILLGYCGPALFLFIGIGLTLSELGKFNNKYTYAARFFHTSKLVEFTYIGERMEGRQIIHVYEFGDGEKFEVTRRQLDLPPSRLVRVGPDPRHSDDPTIPTQLMALTSTSSVDNVASIYAQFYDESVTKGRSKAYVVAGGFAIMFVASLVVSKNIRRAISKRIYYR